MIGCVYLKKTDSIPWISTFSRRMTVPPKDISRLTAELRGVAKRSPLERFVRRQAPETLDVFQDKARIPRAIKNIRVGTELPGNPEPINPEACNNECPIDPDTRPATACHAPERWHETTGAVPQFARVKKHRRGANGCGLPSTPTFRCLAQDIS